MWTRGVSRRTPGSPGFNVIFSSMVFPPVFLRKNYEKQVILTEKRCWASTLHISWLRPCGQFSLLFSIFVTIFYFISVQFSGSQQRQKIYSCRFCNKPFDRPSYVTKHERIHTGEKPYSCGICGKSLTEKGNLKAHLVKHLKTL